LFVEDFDDRDMSRFTITDQQGSLLTLVREDAYQPDGRDGYLLERALRSEPDGFGVENLTSFAQTVVADLEDADQVRLTASVAITSPAGGTATFGLGVGQPLLAEPAYAVYLTTGFELFVLGLTRNDGTIEPIATFPPSGEELELALMYDRDSGLVEASVSELDGPLLMTSSFHDPTPLRPTVLLFYTRLSTSRQSVFRIDDIVLREE
jgi:hypothetical protein